MSGARPKAKLWSVDLVLASIVNFVLAFVFYAFMTTMAVYAVAQFAVSDTAGGLAASIYVLGATAARLFAGNVVDLVGRRRVLVFSLVLFVITSLSYFLVEDSFIGLLTVRAVHGVVFAVASTAAIALAQSVIPRSRLAEGTGYFALSTTLAAAIGPFLALKLVAGPGYESLFVAGVVAAVAGLVLALFVRTPDLPIEPEHRARLRRFHPTDMLHPAVLPAASFILVIAVAYSAIVAYLQSFGVERDLVPGAGAFFLAYAAVLFLARLIAGRIQDEFGDNAVVYLAIVGFSAGLALLALAHSNLAVVISGGLVGFGFGTLVSALQSVAVGKVPINRLGVAVSTYFFMLDLGMGLGPIVLGTLLAATNFGEMYGILAGVVLASSLLYRGVHGKKHGHRRSIAAKVEQAHADRSDVIAEPDRSPCPG